MKTFMVPCFVIVEADNKDAALKLAEKQHQKMKNGTILLLDSKLPTVEVTPEDILARSMVGIVGNSL